MPGVVGVQPSTPMKNQILEDIAAAPRLEHGKPVFDQSEWLRLPPPGGRCSVVPLSRSTLTELVRPCARNNFSPPVEARVLRRKGAQRGILLISKRSLLSFINGQPTPSRRAEATEGGEAA